MAQDQNAPNAVEQAVSRAVRDNLERIQRASEELHHAVSDVVSACASNKPANVLPPMLRAQTAAASLAATLEVLTKFVASSLQTSPRSPLEAQLTSMVSQAAAEASVAPLPAAAPAAVAPPPVAATPEIHTPAPAPVEVQHQPEPELELAEPAVAVPDPVPTGEFDINRLSSEDQELHRRANRVAKVSMQDIKMLRPEAVRLGRENKDLCVRLKDDIEKAHREYERRFKPIMDQPVDYFYQWTLQILADGNAEALGDYPYSSPVRQH